MSFTFKPEEYYNRFIELQEKLRKSEEERLKLEMKFNEMVQITREEEQMHYRKLRGQYKRFLEEDRRRQDRNERILRTLERIESRVAMLVAKTERFKLLRRQYQTYLDRIYRVNQIQKTEPVREKQEATKSKLLDDNDIVQTYLQNLSSNKLREMLEKEEAARGRLPVATPDEKFGYSEYDPDSDRGFKPNYANSFADDIINSIYSRHKVVEGYKDRPPQEFNNNIDLKPSAQSVKDQIPNNWENLTRPVKHLKKSETDHFSEVDDSDKGSIIYKGSINKSSVESEQSKQGLNDGQRLGKMIDDSLSSRMLNRQFVSDGFNKKDDPQVPVRKDTNSSDIVDNNRSKLYQNREEKPSLHRVDNLREEVDPLLKEQKDQLKFSDYEDNHEKFEEKLDEKVLPQPLADVVPFERTDLKGTPVEIKNEEFEGKEREVDISVSAVDEQPVLQKYEEESVSEKDQKTIQSIHEEYHQSQHDEKDTNLQQYEEIVQPFKETIEQDEQYAVQQKQPIPEYEESVQQIQIRQEQYDVQGQLLQEPLVESEQPLSHYYDDQGQVEQFDENGQALLMQQQFDEKGQPLMQSYDDRSGIQQQQEFEESVQPGSMPLYDEQIQLQQYDEHGQFVQQYDEMGQPIPIQQYDEHGQCVQQYDDQGQYVQQYDQAGQPIQSYVGNLQPVQQYDESGQPIIQQMYDQNQYLQQYDENGQPISQYDEQYDQQQYDESQQPYQQYDENGQLIQQYDYGEQQNVQYDESGRVIPSNDQFYNQPYEGTVEQADNSDLQQEKENEKVVAEEAPMVAAGNVMEMLDTDTESVKQDTKVSHDSDFDFSNA